MNNVASPTIHEAQGRTADTAQLAVDGTQAYWLQADAITAGPEPEPELEAEI